MPIANRCGLCNFHSCCTFDMRHPLFFAFRPTIKKRLQYFQLKPLVHFLLKPRQLLGIKYYRSAFRTTHDDEF